MLKLNASYSKKVPAEADYSSQQYHCQIEVELPDGLTQEQIQGRIHETFGLVRQSVETELQTARQTMQAMQPQMPPPQQYPQQQPVQQQAVQQQAVQQYNPQQQNYQQNGYAQQDRQKNQNKQYRNGNANAAASPKQVNYLLSLAKRAGWTVQQILQRCQIPNIEAIPSKVCSQLIQEFSGAAA